MFSVLESEGKSITVRVLLKFNKTVPNYFLTSDVHRQRIMAGRYVVEVIVCVCIGSLWRFCNRRGGNFIPTVKLLPNCSPHISSKCWFSVTYFLHARKSLNHFNFAFECFMKRIQDSL